MSQYLTLKNKIELVTKNNNFSLQEYKYGTLTHSYPFTPFSKGDLRKLDYLNDRVYKLNLLAELFLHSEIDDEIFDILQTKSNGIKHSTEAASYYNIGSGQDYRKVTDIFAKMLIKPEMFNVDNSVYIEKLFTNPDFYKNKKEDNYYQFKDFYKKEDTNIDFGKYAFLYNNPLALNFIYKEVKEFKVKYQEFIFDEMSLIQLKNVLEHYKSKKNNDWTNSTDPQDKIKKIDSLFYNVNFLLLFANTEQPLNDNQKDILKEILKDKTLVGKLQQNAGKNGIYSKYESEQLASKDVFLIATIRKNTDFINILFESGYKPNPEESGLILSNSLREKIDILNKINVSDIDFLKQKIVEQLSKIKKDLDFVKDINIDLLQEDYDKYKHSPFLTKTLKRGTNPTTLYYENNLHYFDCLAISDAFYLPAFYAKGFKNVNQQIENFVLDKICFSTSGSNINKNNNNNDNDLPELINFIDTALDKHPDHGKGILQHIFLNTDNKRPYIYPMIDFYLHEKMSDFDYSEEDKKIFSTTSLSFFNALSEEEKQNFYGEELQKHKEDLAINYAQVLSYSDRQHPLSDKALYELTTLIMANKEIIPNIEKNIYVQNNFEKLMSKIEKQYLTTETTNIKNEKQNKKRL